MIILILIILMIVTPVLAFFMIRSYKKRKENNDEELNTIRRSMERHHRRMDSIRRRSQRLQNVSTERTRDHQRRNEIHRLVDGWREEHGLRPIYGPNGIRTEMNREREETYLQRHLRRHGFIDQDIERVRRELFNRPVINQPKEGDIREDCIIANKPEHGVRVYEFRNGKWNLQSNLKPIDFLTDDDMVIE